MGFPLPTTVQRVRTSLFRLLARKQRRLIRMLRPSILKEMCEYPSVINNGYLHIERTIELAKHLDVCLDDPIVDVGAASGEVALIFSEAFPRTPIYCFEPIKSSFEQLLRSTADRQQVIPRNIALGSEAGQFPIQLMHRISSSSFLSAVDSIQDDFLAENIRRVGEETVSVSTLDEQLDEDGDISIIKLDVQGFELEVLRGGSRALKRTSMVLVELQNHGIYEKAPRYYEVDAFLRESSFSLYDMIPSIRGNRRVYEWDAIYVCNRIAGRFDT